MEEKNKKNIIVAAVGIAAVGVLSFFGYKHRDKIKKAVGDLKEGVSDLFKKEEEKKDS